MKRFTDRAMAIASSRLRRIADQTVARTSGPAWGIAPLRIAVALLFAVFALNSPAAEMKAIELAVETHANAALLPSGPSSALVVTPCKGCSPLSLPATANTRYFVGRELVSLTELKRRLESRPTAMLTILYLKDSRELSRVIVSAP